MGGHLLLRTIAEHRPALAGAVLVAPMIAFNVTPIPTWLGQRIAGPFSRLGWSERRACGETERTAPAGSSRHAYLTTCHYRYSDALWWTTPEPGYGSRPPHRGCVDTPYQTIARISRRDLGH